MALSSPRAWLPLWVRSLGGPAWVVGPDRILHYINRPMRALLGVGADAIGRPCWEIIRGRDTGGWSHCGPRCRPLGEVLQDRAIHPALVAVASDPVRWLHVLVIPLRAPDGSFPWLVHGAVPCGAPTAAERTRGAAGRRRSLAAARGVRRRKLAALTRREREVVELLCRGESLHRIAERLGVRYVTVRNHVQHIEAKLGVHSLLEIVAFGMTSPLPPTIRRR